MTSKTKLAVALWASAYMLAEPVHADVQADSQADEQAKELQALRERVKALEEKLSVDATEPPRESRTNALSERISFAGDARYRAESIDVGDVDNDRQRVRARVGLEARITDTMMTALRLSTGEGDPRSAHLTFSGGYSRRTVGVDLAYLQWSALPGLRIAGGKVPYPNWQPSQSVFIGGDFNPEGWSTSYRAESGVFANAHHFWLQTNVDADDSRQSGLQLGFASDAQDATRFTLAGAYTDFTHVAGERPFLDGVNSYGNSLDAAGGLLDDFNIAELATEVTLERYPGALTLFAHAAQNVAVSQNDVAYAAGVTASPSRLKHWRFGYQYARIEKDALFGQLMDGDFGGGRTDSSGHSFRVGYRPEGRWSSTLTYLHNRVNISSAAALPFDLIQLDIDFVY